MRLTGSSAQTDGAEDRQGAMVAALEKREELQVDHDCSPRLISLSARLVVISFATFGYLLLAFVVWSSRLLRPIADDYWLGLIAKDGVFPAIQGWWNTLGGNLTSMLIDVVLVGLPVLYLPWWIASAIPFLCAAVALGALSSWILLHSDRRLIANRKRLLGVVIMLPMFLISWWAYWWVPALYSNTNPSEFPLAVGVTTWQSLNAEHVLAAALLIWAWLTLECLRLRWRFALALLYMLLGLAAGLNGPVIAMSTVIMMPMLMVGSALLGRRKAIQRWPLWAMTGAGALIGGAISYFSPGSQARMACCLARPPRDVGLVSALITEGVPSGIESWWQTLANPGSLTVALMILGSTFLVVQRGWSLRIDYLFLLSLGLLGFSLVLSVANRLSEYFAYPGFWHMTRPSTVAWVGLMTFALALGGCLATLPRSDLTMPVASFAVAIGISLAASSIAFMAVQIQVRWSQWEVGPAPVPGLMGDIESGSEWRPIWQELTLLRGESIRGLTDGR